MVNIKLESPVELVTRLLLSFFILVMIMIIVEKCVKCMGASGDFFPLSLACLLW